MFIVCIILLFILLIICLLIQAGLVRKPDKKINPIDDTKSQNLTEYFKLDNVFNTEEKILTEDKDKVLNFDDTSNAENALEFPLIQSDNNKILTSGESDYYKSLLKDERWITLKNQKLKENSGSSDISSDTAIM